MRTQGTAVPKADTQKKCRHITKASCAEKYLQTRANVPSLPWCVSDSKVTVLHFFPVWVVVKKSQTAVCRWTWRQKVNFAQARTRSTPKMKTWVFSVLVAAVTAQLPSELPSTCASTSCLTGTTCKEVYNPTTGIISGQCLTNVQPTRNENVCSEGQPLYVLQSGTPVQAFCGRGLNRIECPSGYECNIAPNDIYAVCCPSAALVTPVTGTSDKPGQCPAPVTDGSVAGICANMCSEDSDCSGDLKCCSNECGALTCQQPQEDTQPLTCANTLCPPGTQCEMQQVQCFRAPCDPLPACVAIEKEGVCPRPIFTWFIFWSRRWCQKDCQADADCPNFQKCCSDHNGCGTTCRDPDPPVTCATAKCSAGSTCVMQQVQCIRAPCFPVPNCVEIADACNPPCRASDKCEMRDNRCYFGSDCGQSPQCVKKPVCLPACRSDYECQWQKSQYCFFGVCAVRAQCVLKPSCPLYPAWINPNCVRTDECSTSDPNACSEGLLCCSTDCGRKCVRPL